MVKALVLDCHDANDPFLILQVPLLELLPELRSFTTSPILPSQKSQELLIRTLVRYNPQLLHLGFCSALLQDLWSFATIIGLTALPRLKSLSISGVDALTSNPSQAFRHLQELAIEEKTFVPGEFSKILQVFPPSLLCLRIADCDDVPRDLATRISEHCPNLRVLSLFRNTTDPASLQPVNTTEWPTLLKNLVCLFVSEDMVSPIEFLHLGSPLSRLVLCRVKGLSAFALISLLYRVGMAKEGLHVSVVPSPDEAAYTLEEKAFITVRSLFVSLLLTR